MKQNTQLFPLYYIFFNFNDEIYRSDDFSCGYYTVILRYIPVTVAHILKCSMYKETGPFRGQRRPGPFIKFSSNFEATEAPFEAF